MVDGNIYLSFFQGPHIYCCARGPNFWCYTPKSAPYGDENTFITAYIKAFRMTVLEGCIAEPLFFRLLQHLKCDRPVNTKYNTREEFQLQICKICPGFKDLLVFLVGILQVMNKQHSSHLHQNTHKRFDSKEFGSVHWQL